MNLLIITGLPCTGKTTFGRKISDELQIPFISKDDIKELLFESFGWEDREWSKKIGGASYDLMYYIAEQILKTGKSLIIETNFNPKFADKKLNDLKENYNFNVIQIRCFTDGKILFERFKNRAEFGERHPGHVDAENLDEWKPILLQGKIEKINIEGVFFDIDTTDFEKNNFKEIIEIIKSKIN